MHWYVVGTKPHHERIAEIALEQFGVEIFSPLIKEHRVVRRVRREVVSPMFPGYLFARFELETQYRAVIHARGVRKVVSFGESPAIVDDAMIDTIKGKLSKGCLVLPSSEFRSGQVVRIHEGPLRGLEGVFQKQISGSQRAILLLRALSYQAKVVVHLGDIVNL